VCRTGVRGKVSTSLEHDGLKLNRSPRREASRPHVANSAYHRAGTKNCENNPMQSAAQSLPPDLSAGEPASTPGGAAPRCPGGPKPICIPSARWSGSRLRRGFAEPHAFRQSGLQRHHARPIVTPGTLFYTVAGSATATLFDGLTLYHKQKAAEAALDQAARSTIRPLIAALQNVADACAACRPYARAVQPPSSRNGAKATLEIVQKQLVLGQINQRHRAERPAGLSERRDRPRPGSGRHGLPTPPRCSWRWAAAGRELYDTGLARMRAGERRPSALQLCECRAMKTVVADFGDLEPGIAVVRVVGQRFVDLLKLALVIAETRLCSSFAALKEASMIGGGRRAAWCRREQFAQRHRVDAVVFGHHPVVAR